MPQTTLRNYFATLLLATLLCGCDPAPCVENGLESDQTYRVTFLELYNESSTLAEWDPEIPSSANRECDLQLPAMANFEATATAEESLDYPNSCTAWVLDLHELTGASRITATSDPGGSPMSQYRSVAAWRAEIEMSGCNAEWTVHLLAPEDGDPLVQPQSSAPPPLLVYRELDYTEGDGCGDAPTSCHEYWTASLDSTLAV